MTVGVYGDVVRFDVAVDDVVAMKEVDSAAELLCPDTQRDRGGAGQVVEEIITVVTHD